MVSPHRKCSGKKWSYCPQPLDVLKILIKYQLYKNNLQDDVLDLLRQHNTLIVFKNFQPVQAMLILVHTSFDWFKAVEQRH